MFYNYLKIAVRNLLRHKSFSAINIAGLALGIASCLLLFTVIRYELSFDRFQPDYSNIYHVVTEDKYEDGITYNPGVPVPTLEGLRVQYPQIKMGALFSSYGSQVTVLSNNSAENKFIEPSGFFFADPEFFQVFHFDWIQGSPDVLAVPDNTVLTKSTAAKYFGDWKNAMGKLLRLDNLVTVKVAGILNDPPPNTDFPLKIVTSMKTVKANADAYSYADTWNSTSSNFQIFMELPSNISAATMDKQLVAFSKKNFVKHQSVKTSFLQPLSDVHFDKRFTNFGDHVTSRTTLLTLSLVGLFILIMACINFINLSTAQAVGRSKEIGIRKVLGSKRQQLFFQVLLETGVLVLISILLAVGISVISLPLIKNVAFIPSSVPFFTGKLFLFLAILFVIVTFLAGVYPALILSGFKPIQALKNKITSATMGGVSLRKSLVVVQFGISQILIIATLIVISQMSFVKNADLGFNQQAILLFNSSADSTVHSRQEAFKQRLLQIPGVKSVSFSSDVPSSDNGWFSNFSFDHRPDVNFAVSLKFADEDYFKTYGLEFAAGKPYGKSDAIKELVINETLAKQLGLKNPEDAVGKEIRIGGQPWKTITGVVKDFKTNSLRESVKPVILAENKPVYGVTGIKLNSSNIQKTKASVENVWNQFFPEYAYTTSFMEEDIQNFYKLENQLESLYKIFAGIAIFISCLGLYGLVSFMAVQKTKEIGVRKVLGASVKNILVLFSKEFTILILISSVFAIPVAWYMMNHWLQNFTFRIKMNPGTFIIAVAISLIIAWISVGYKSFKAALTNPLQNLRSE